VFGFDFLENFNYPYVSKSVAEFWRRWHISLGSWFRDYIYIPLGGNRVSSLKIYRNLFVVWLVTGIWHGASWNFVIWGLYYFAILVIEKLFLGKYLEKIPAFFSHTYSLLLIVLGWMIFYFKPDFGGWSALSSYFSGMIGALNIPFINLEFGYTAIRNFVLIFVLAIASTPYPKKMFLKWRDGIKNEKMRMAVALVSDLLLVFVFVMCIVYITSSAYRPNIYFEF
jgi:alginate O-acetyltransferase complex protein AlgI